MFLLVSGSCTADNSYCYFTPKAKVEERTPLIPAISIFKQANLHRFQGLGIILCGLRLLLLTPGLHPLTIALPSLGPGLCLQNHLASILNGTHVCCWVALSACFLFVRFWEPHSLLSFHLPSILSVRDGDCSCWFNMLKSPVVSHVCLEESMPFTQKAHSEILYSCFYWDESQPILLHISLCVYSGIFWYLWGN